jgi:N,N'-diacetyllegionaminate synthase
MTNVFLIAEAGVNHNGSIENALKLIDAAVAAGADAVKFQTFKASEVVTETARKANYQIRNTGGKESQFEMLKKLELPLDAHKRLIAYCGRKKIMFLSTPFDFGSADMLAELGLKIFKVPSGEITNKPLIAHIAAKRRPIILSTGMSYLSEVGDAIRWINAAWGSRPPKPFRTDKNAIIAPLTVLQCVSNYPAAPADSNLLAMNTMARVFRVPAGFSDHSLGTEISIAAAALGAGVIEKHFTLNRKMKGPDHAASLEPDELRSMIQAIRNVSAALGDGKKAPSDSEIDTRSVARRSIVAARAIKKGELFTLHNIAFKRPGTGKSPGAYEKLLGRKALKSYQKDDEL